MTSPTADGQGPEKAGGEWLERIWFDGKGRPRLTMVYEAEMSMEIPLPAPAEVRAVKREHILTEDCWCFPTVTYVDPINGNKVVVHTARGRQGSPP